jgi:HlyD family secretion protein
MIADSRGVERGAGGRGPSALNGRRLVLALAAAAAVAALYAWSNAGGGRWVRAEKRDLVIGIPFEGQLVALENIELGPPEIGTDIWQYSLVFLAADGKAVKAGEPVMGFDTSEILQLLAAAQAQRDETDKTLEKRRIEIEIQRRQRRLQLAETEARLRRGELALAVPADLLARRGLEKTRIERRLAEEELGFRRRSLAALDRAEEIEMDNLREQSQLAAAKVDRLDRAARAMTVVAPRDGTVIARQRGNNEKAKIGENIWRAEKVLQIPDLSTLRARVDVDEALGGRLALGQRASFYLDAHPDRQLEGRVEVIGQSVGRKSPADPTRILKVTLSVGPGAGAALALRPGMRLRGQVELERRAEVLAIPEEAVFSDGEGLYVEAGGLWGTRRLRPQLGRRGQGFFEVLGGLEPGQRLRLPAPVAAGGGA